MTITKSHVAIVAGALCVLMIGSCMIDAGLFSSAPRPEVIFGVWELDDEEVEVRAEAVAESLRSQGADVAAAQAARDLEFESMRQHATMTLSISDDTMRVNGRSGKERSWAVTYSSAKPDIVYATSIRDAGQQTFRVHNSSRIELMQEMGPAIPLRRIDGE